MANAEKKIRFTIEGEDSSLQKTLHDSSASLDRFTGGLGTARAAVSIFQTAIAGVSMGFIARELLEAGMAADRFRNSFAAAAGSMAIGQSEFAFAREEANRLGLDLGSTANAFLKLSAAARGTALEGEPAREIFSAVSEAATALGLSSDEAGGALLSISQMMSKGTVQSEELRGQLGERLPGAFQIAARAMGVSTAELGKMLEKGQVLTDDFIPKFGAQLKKEFPASEAATKGLGAEVNRLKNSFDEMKKAVMDSGGNSLFSYLAREVTELNKQLTDNIRLMGDMGTTWDMMKDKAGLWGGAALSSLGHVSTGNFGAIPGVFDSAISGGKELTRQQLERLKAPKDPFLFTPEETAVLRQQFIDREQKKEPSGGGGNPPKVQEFEGLTIEKMAGFMDRYNASQQEIGYSELMAEGLGATALAGSSLQWKPSLPSYSLFGPSSSGFEQSASDGYKTEIAERASLLEQALMTEEETIASRYADRLSLVQEAENAGVLSKLAAVEMKKRIEEDYIGSSMALIGGFNSWVRQGELERAAFEKASWEQKAQTTFSSLVAMTNAVANSNKTMFAINKAFRIGEAVMEGYAGAIKTWNAWPYPWNIPMTAAHVAMSGMYISQLASSNYGGQQGSPGGNYGGGTPTSPIVTQPASSQPAQPTQIQVHFHGDMYGDKMDRWIEDKFAPAFRDAVGRNVVFDIR